MRNLAPSRALVRRSRRLIEVAFVIVAAGIFLAVFGLALFAVPLTSETSNSFSLYNIGRTALLWGGVLLGLVGLTLAARALTWKTENDVAYKIGEHLKQHLSDEYTFIRNISRRNLGYIDAVLVGPAGVLVFRTLDSTGRFLNERLNWLKANNRDEWKPMLSSPSQETIEDIKSLREYFAENDLKDMPIFGIVVFLHDDPKAHLILKEPVVPATHMSSLYRRLQSSFLAKEDRMSSADAAKIVKLLYRE